MTWRENCCFCNKWFWNTRSVALGFLNRVTGHNQFVSPFREICAMLLLAKSIKGGWLCPLLVYSREGVEGSGGTQASRSDHFHLGISSFSCGFMSWLRPRKVPGSQVIVVWMPLTFILFFRSLHLHTEPFLSLT